MLLQLLLLGKKFKPADLLQIPVSVILGYFIDLSMFLLSWVQPEQYFFNVLYLLIGCVILGFGVFLEIIANVVMLPGEAFVRAVTIRFGTDFGITKICFDSSIAVLAVLISLPLFHTSNGVREGTVLAALLVGLIAKFFGKLLRSVDRLLTPQPSDGEIR